MTFGSRVLVTVGVPPVEVEGVYVGGSDWPGFVVVRVDGVPREVEAGKVRPVLPDPRANGVHP
mgnify:CR=1 FL=1